MRKHDFIATRKMIILQNMRKEKDKLDNNNTSDRENIITHKIFIVKNYNATTNQELNDQEGDTGRYDDTYGKNEYMEQLD